MQHVGILDPQPGIKPMPPVMEAQNINHWTAWQVPLVKIFKDSHFICN